MAPLGSSSSAPDIGAVAKPGRSVKDHARLQSLLSKATSGGPRLPPLRSVGGAPRSSALPPRISASGGAAGSSSPPGRSASLGALRGGSSPTRPAYSEHAGEYVRKLTGKANGSDGPQDWTLVQELDVVDSVLQEDQKRRQLAAQKQLMRSELSVQRDAKLRRSQDARDDQSQWQDKLQTNANSFYQEQADKREADRQAQSLLNQERARCLEVTKKCRQYDKEHDLEIERLIKERNIEARRIEEAKAEAKKRRGLEEAQRVQKEREQASELKKEKRNMEARQDVESMVQQQEEMDRRERERHSKAEKIRETQTQRSAHFEAGAGNKVLELARNDEARRQKDLEQRAMKESRELQEKQQKKQQDAQGRGEAMRTQLKEMKDRREREQEESLKLAKEFQRNAEAAMEDEKKKQQEKREKAKEHAICLLNQMQDKTASIPGRFGYQQMTEVEKSMNRERLNRAKSNDSLQVLFRNKQAQFKSTRGIDGKPVYPQ